MAQVWTPKQQNWVQRFSNNIVGFLANVDALSLQFTEATNDGFLTGGAEAIVDTTVQLILPAGTAAAMNTAMGAFANTSQIFSIVAANRQALELMRP